MDFFNRALLLILLLLPLHGLAKQNRPKLLLVVVIDQFRADYLLRFKSKLIPPIGKDGKIGGFRYLMEKGAYFPLGEHDVAQSMTAPGHATILTGAYPYQSGIPLNNWYDRRSGQVVSATGDLQFVPVASVALEQKSAGSPKNLIASNVGDELKTVDSHSRVVSIATKQIPSILLGGHRADIAIWYEPKSRQSPRTQVRGLKGNLRAD